MMIRYISAFFICTYALTANAAGFGTGFFVSSKGHFITNAHVIADAHQVTVRTSDGATDIAQVISVDRNNDLALLKIDRPSKGLHLKTTDGLDKGAKVFTIGYPNPSLQGLEAKYTEGVVSSFSGIAGTPNVMQITVPIQPGNSGGPLVDTKGSVVGVIVSKLNALAVAAKQDYIPENVNYAVKSDYALPLLLAIPSPERATPRLGLSVRDAEASVVLVAAFGLLPVSKTLC
ncbi:MAG: S1C family serine protease [Hylemonella sp.]|uniref:S1C family serine protease n=1 Tax=Hylemonella sp. TaxID=2066020 RepID=UPI00391A7F8D